ncbi:hypothetical protein ANCCEY_07458 [Ancylostoma ceylanicum]|uniref:Battenin n=1 Tax=Ancylostoma ceylanicum TaxID=53326 RepID=A0A0D6LTR6_9BILA|nr:hypothetical protein ANCCEY_07458 [Ancylostoma ceylanicum]
MTVAKSKNIPYRNLFSFWIFGLCNNFAYSVMLSAAQDILNKHKGEDPIEDNVTDATVRHTTVCVAQASSLIVTAFADSVPVALGGVCLASFSSGLGETTYLGLAGHYSK